MNQAMTIAQAIEQAVMLHQAGALQQAEGIYRQVLAADSTHPGALHGLGLIAHQVGQNTTAVDLIRQAIAVCPHAHEFHSNLGNILCELLAFEQSEAACREAIRLSYSLAEAHCNLGNALHGQQLYEQAVDAFQTAARLKSGYSMAHSNLGGALSELGRLEEAVTSYDTALQIQPELAEALAGRAGALHRLGRFQAAIESCNAALRSRPNMAEALNHLGNSLCAVGRLDEAVVALRSAVANKPSLAPALNNLANILKEQGEIDQAIQWYRKAVATCPSDARIHSNLIYALHFHPDWGARAIFHEHRVWNQHHAEPLKRHLRSHANSRDPQRRMKIGYVSPDLRDHVVGRFLLNLLQKHDRESFEIFAYSDVVIPDEMTGQIKAQTDTWRSIVGQSDSTVAEIVRRDEIDVLIDLAAHSSENRMKLFALKPAPVQVTYLAYPGTTGLDAMDYRLTDQWLDPPGAHDGFYSEQSIRLPRTYWCYRQPVDAPDCGPPPAEFAGYLTFGCLNNFCKLSDSCLHAWGKLLQGLPKSRLILHSLPGNHRQRVYDILHAQGVDPQRVNFVGVLSPADYYAMYRSIDVCLDPFPYTGGTTTCDALWMGVPVVTLAGNLAVHRGGVSILSCIGLHELIADSQEQYIRIAAELASDLSRLNKLRQTLRERLFKSPLMDAVAFARDLEAAYRMMWQNYCSSEKPSI